MILMLPLVLAFNGPAEDRVTLAYRNAEGQVQEMCKAAKVAYPPQRIYLRAFKSERVVEVWGSNGGRKPFRLLHSYAIAAASGNLGPKLKEGDGQVPEGFYFINRFNPFSSYHLSLGLNYPNARDRKVSDPVRPGGDIFIHGNRVSIGCLAMTDPKIEEIYVLALEAKKAGQSKIPVHIFPFRPDGDWPSASPGLTDFWKSLRPAYDRFEKTRFVPNISVARNGAYVVQR